MFLQALLQRRGGKSLGVENRLQTCTTSRMSGEVEIVAGYPSQAIARPICYSGAIPPESLMAEISLAILVVSVLFIADPDRLQMVLDRIRELVTWLGE